MAKPAPHWQQIDLTAPHGLRQAREALGLSPAQMALALGYGDMERRSAREMIYAWESEASPRAPTRQILNQYEMLLQGARPSTWPETD